MGHPHVHPPHELSESREQEDSTPPPPAERRLERFSVLLLAPTTPATAWSGYQAARRSGEQSQHNARASTMDRRSLKVAVLGMALTLLVRGTVFVLTPPPA